MLLSRKKRAQREAERLEAERKAREKNAAEEKAAKQALEEIAKAERIAREKAEAERAAEAARQKEEAEKAAKRSEAAKKAAATRAAKKAEADRLEAERVAREAAEAKRIARENAPVKGCVEIKQSRDGRYVYVIRASNAQLIAKSAQTYASIATCKSAVASVAKIAKTVPVEDRSHISNEKFKYPKFELYIDNEDKFRFRLCASNGQNLLTCARGYAQKTACKNAIASVAINCAGEIIIGRQEGDI